MGTRNVLTACVTLGLASLVSGGLRAAPTVNEARPFVLNGAVVQVDTDRERVILAGNDGHRWTLDTSGADITLPDGSRAGATSDLTPGMHVRVSGRQLAVGVAEAETVRVLNTDPQPHSKPLPTPTIKAPVTKAPVTKAPVGAAIELRGTVDSVQTRLGTFVVRIQTHTRTIYLADDTDLSGTSLGDSARFPVKPGDRVTVSGRLQGDGSVLAGAVSLSKTISLTTSGVRPTGASNRVLFGRISSTSNRYTGRDFKVRLADDREIKVKVRRGLLIRQEGRSVSVHDLHTGDDVRVTGAFDGGDFKAERIDVFNREETNQADAPDAPSPPMPSRRGL